MNINNYKGIETKPISLIKKIAKEKEERINKNIKNIYPEYILKGLESNNINKFICIIGYIVFKEKKILKKKY